MTTLRTAAQQALEDICGAKLCEINSMSSRMEMLRLMDKAIIALKAALAEPVQEPITRLFGTLPVHDAQQAEPEEQMPVGWLESPHGAFRADPLYKMQFPSQILQWQIALYAAPPQRKQAQRDALLEALKSTGLFLHHCWCDVQMNEYSFEKLNQQMAVVDAAIALVEGRVKAVEEGK